MNDRSRTRKAQKIRRLLATEGPSVYTNTTDFNRRREHATAGLTGTPRLRDRARTVKEDAVDRLPELIDMLQRQVESHGGHAFLASDGEDARTYIQNVVDDRSPVIKSKTMTGEEIGLREHLASNEINVVETDLGEWVLQVADETPSHLVVPAMHKSRNAIARLINDRFNLDPPLESAEELTSFARNHLGTVIRRAAVGITGANFLIADSGTVVLVTSEGNARKTAFVPPTYIAIAGVEKIIPHLTDLEPFLKLLGRSATGQSITSYTSLFTPPFEAPVYDFDENTVRPSDEREFHLVLLDNGRLDLRQDPDLRETLFCIRCGACANSCTNFQQVGGHAFGGKTYTGGIASGWETAVHGLDHAANANDLCTGCTRCVPACPVKIDIPWINTAVQARRNEAATPNLSWLPQPLRNNSEKPPAGSLRSQLFAKIDQLASRCQPWALVTNTLNRTTPFRWFLDRTIGLSRHRPLPTFHRTTLTQWFADRRSAPDARHKSNEREVTFYTDLYTNYFQRERGIKTITILEALGWTVHVTAPLESGRAPLSQGQIESARENVETVVRTLQPHFEDDRSVIVLEPTDLAMFQREAGRLLPKAPATQLQEHTTDLFNFLKSTTTPTEIQQAFAAPFDGDVFLHSHCQERTLNRTDALAQFLRIVGYTVHRSSAECCGMAGSFGYKSEYYELSRQAGQTVVEERNERTASESLFVVTGASCRDQFEHLAGERVYHPIELIERKT